MLTQQPQPPHQGHHGNQRQELLEHALAYAEAGWPVFPLRPGTKRPATPTHTADNCDQTDPKCCSAKGHTGWEDRATTNHGRITRAWDNRLWGIGIACGPARLTVIDLDIPKQPDAMTGVEALQILEHEHGQQLPATFTVATPSGGRHLYYTNPRGTTHRNTASHIGPYIDTRSAGGYVAAPPTRLDDGSAYHIINSQQPAELPQWFSQLLIPPPRRTTPVPSTAAGRCIDDTRVERYVQSAVNGELDRIDRAVEGQRNHTLFSASIALGQLVAGQLLGATDAEHLLTSAADKHAAAGAYSPTQARQTITSGLNRGLKEPRQLPTAQRSNR